MFWEDYYLKNPTHAKMNEKGEVTFRTGDPLIDKWEQEIAAGIEPDLLEGLPPHVREKEQKEIERRKTDQKLLEEIGAGFSENYA